MLARLRELAEAPTDTNRRGRRARASISELVREALSDFLDRRERLRREEIDRAVIARHRKLLARQAAALVREQVES